MGMEGWEGRKGEESEREGRGEEKEKEGYPSNENPGYTSLSLADWFRQQCLQNTYVTYR